MKAMLITVKGQYACEIMNGNKTIEVRKNTALANGIKKLIAEYGKAIIYVAVSKDNKSGIMAIYDDNDRETWVDHYELVKGKMLVADEFRSKVAFMFECEKVEDIIYDVLYGCYHGYGKPIFDEKNREVDTEWKLSPYDLEKHSCLTQEQLNKYLKGKNGYAIHISNLTIFDRPKEISEFTTNKKEFYCNNCKYYRYEFNDNRTRVNYCDNYKHNGTYKGNLDMPLSCELYKHKLTKAPENFCYIEVGE